VRYLERVSRRGIWLCIWVFAGLAGSACAEVKVDFWHSYVHQPSGTIHYSFQIASYKRGLFFGSCGPSTRSLRWEYDIDLAGVGPVYQKEQITMRCDLKPVDIASGTIRVDLKRREAFFDLRLQQTNRLAAFPGNGTYPIKLLK
jgi:hypothetical protein